MGGGGWGGRSHLKKPGYRGEEGDRVGGFSGEENIYGNMFWLIEVRFATTGRKRGGGGCKVENKTSSMSGKKLNSRKA